MGENIAGTRRVAVSSRSITGRAWRALGVAAVAFAAGCASTAALPEFRAYGDAFGRAEVASAEILDEFALAERAIARERIGNGLHPTDVGPGSRPDAADNIAAFGFDPTFHLPDAVYHAGVTDPPVAAAFRRALAAVARFNEVVLAYAEGRALDELKREASALGTELDAARATVLAATGGAASVAAPPAAAALGPALKLVADGVTLALRASSREVFRDAVSAQAGSIDRILVTVRDGAPSIFEALAFDVMSEAKLSRRDEARAAPLRAKVETYRKLVSSWVVLIDDVRAALESTVVATRAPRGEALVLADLTRNTAELRAGTDRMRALLIELRRGPAAI